MVMMNEILSVDPELMEKPAFQRKWPMVMVDIETLGTAPGAVILEVGAVCFDPETMTTGPAFSQEVGLRSDGNGMREIDEDTLIWWAERLKDGAMMPGLHDGGKLVDVLYGLRDYLQENLRDGYEVWSWGVDFDLGILADAFRDFAMDVPWKYFQQRDARTICKAMGVERKGEVTHTALGDAEQEAHAVMRALRCVEDKVEGGAL